MNERIRIVIQIVALLTICAFVIWSVVYFHSNGIYPRMRQWLEMDKGYITVLYNLALMVITGTVLGILMERITRLLGWNVHKIEHFDRKDTARKEC